MGRHSFHGMPPSLSAMSWHCVSYVLALNVSAISWHQTLVATSPSLDEEAHDLRPGSLARLRQRPGPEVVDRARRQTAHGRFRLERGREARPRLLVARVLPLVGRAVT